jgi:serine/threonine protein kinase
MDGGSSEQESTMYPFNVFRKELDMTDYSHKVEWEIANRIMRKPQSNVVTIHNAFKGVNDEGESVCYIDMELLDDTYVPATKYIEDYRKGLEQLHSLDIVYIDIKSDNIGYSQKDKAYKIFDFDCSGTVSSWDNKLWQYPPCESAMYNKVRGVESGLTTLFHLDALAMKTVYPNLESKTRK